LGVFIAGGINVLAAVCYFFAQIIGGLAGAACVLVREGINLNVACCFTPSFSQYPLVSIGSLQGWIHGVGYRYFEGA